MDGVAERGKFDFLIENVQIRKCIPFLTLLLMGGTLLFSPLDVIRQGFIPPDDALRHCAKAVSGRAWSDVLVLDPVYTFDHHYGWHALLGALYHLGIPKEGLLAFSIFGLFMFSLGLPLLMRKRSEFWLLAVATVLFINPSGVHRFLLGRPYLLQTAVTLFICLRWESFAREKVQKRDMLVLLLLVSLAAWCRSTWYLYVLAPGCLFLTGERKAAIRISAVCAGGILIGAMMTMQPWLYFKESTLHFLAATRRDVLPWMLVSEFHPRSPALYLFILVAGILALRKFRGQWRLEAIQNVSFYLLVISALLGFKAVRFWLDFGVPALLAWLSLQFEAMFSGTGPMRDERGWPRLIVVAGACLVFIVSATSDISGRYSSDILAKSLHQEKDREWLPEDGGILYSTNMGIFFRTFYENPYAKWRYVLGFEPGMMTEENKRIYRDIMYSQNDARFFKPWVDQMTSRDRMILTTSGAEPKIPELEWVNIRGTIWSGRLPRTDRNGGSTDKKKDQSPISSDLGNDPSLETP